MSKIAQTPYTALEIADPASHEHSNIAEILLWLNENIVGAYEWKPRPRKKGSPLPDGGPCFDLYFTDKLEAAVFKQRWIGEMHADERNM